jgi:hypothetical protein
MHFLRQAKRYETYGASLRPWVLGWLEAYVTAFGQDAGTQRIDRVGFGYVNEFQFTPEEFDLSRFFRVNFSADLGAGVGLGSFEAKFTFDDRPAGARISFDLAAFGAEGEGKPVRLVTKVFAEKRDFEATFADTALLDQKIHEAKEAAKGCFFALATEETHARMGAVHEAGGSQ